MMKTKKISDISLLTKNRFSTPAEFSSFIETTAVKSNIGLMEVIIDFCQKNDIDIESIAKLINKSLKEKIRVEAESLNYMKKSSKNHTIDKL